MRWNTTPVRNPIDGRLSLSRVRSAGSITTSILTGLRKAGREMKNYHEKSPEMSPAPRIVLFSPDMDFCMSLRMLFQDQYEMSCTTDPDMLTGLRKAGREMKNYHEKSPEMSPAPRIVLFSPDMDFCMSLRMLFQDQYEMSCTTDPDMLLTMVKTMEPDLVIAD